MVPDTPRYGYVSKFEARYRSARTLQATFLESYSENGRLLRAESGTAYFERPGKMRWEYQVPEENLFLVDGKSAWFYVPTDHTVTRVPAKQSTDWRTPLALLAVEPKLSRVCSSVALATTEKAQQPDGVVLFCLLRGAQTKLPTDLANAELAAAQMGEAVFFEIESATGTLARVLIKQPGGVGIEFKFGNWLFNPPLPESLFHFAPASGVAIVNGELSSGKKSVNP